jgi:hypothetical protein
MGVVLSQALTTDTNSLFKTDGLRGSGAFSVWQIYEGLSLVLVSEEMVMREPDIILSGWEVLPKVSCEAVRLFCFS